ncbi:MAG: DUF3226 domain-containing protein [Isosphaeraceae bacterium]
MARSNPNKLLVEGDEEKRTVPYLMDEYVVWGDRPDDWVVEVTEFGGIEPLLKPGVIEVELKTPGLSAVGIAIDANDQFESRWSRIRERCLRVAPDFPEKLPTEGLTHVNEHGLRIGVWIMPDNQSRGMLETFLSYLIMPERSTLWTFAQEACARSRDHGAPYTDSHRDKADIHTYLAWLDPPGRSLHVAVLARALDGRLPLGEQFAKWFIDLFQLTPRPTPISRSDDVSD